MSCFARIFLVLITALTSLSHAGLESVWTRRFSDPNSIYSVEFTKFDPANNVIIAGSAVSEVGGVDIWVAKLEAATGNVAWTFRKNGSQGLDDKIGGIAIAPNGDVFVVGGIQNEQPSDFPIHDAYAARLSAVDGQPIWQTPTGQGLPDVDAWHAASLDGAGGLVVTGVVTDLVNGRGMNIRTAKLSAATGDPIWVREFFLFDDQIAESGDRLFVDPAGEIYVQGMQRFGFVADQPTPPAAVVVRYAPDGTLRGGTRFKELPEGQVFGFLPAQGGGFTLGAEYPLPGFANPTRNLARGLADGSFAFERPIGAVNFNPTISLAENGDILYSGVGPSLTAGIDTFATGRISGTNLVPLWVNPISPPSPPFGAPIGHVKFLGGSSIAVGVLKQQGPTEDVGVLHFGPDGTGIQALILDSNAPNPPETELPPFGPAVDSNDEGGVVVASFAVGGAGVEEVFIRRLQMSAPPQITLVNPTPSNPTVPAFQPVTLSAEVTGLAGLGGTVTFLVNGSPVGTATAAPYEVQYTFPSTGAFTVEASVTSPGGNATTGPITVTAQLPIPNAIAGPASRTGPTTGTFTGGVGVLPLGGTAYFEFAKPLDFELGSALLTTEQITLSPSQSPQPVVIPFTFPEPHQQYTYRLVVVVTDGTETATGRSQPQNFTIPNAPVVAFPDFFFTASGAITGLPTGNDLDDDFAEVLNFLLLTETLPGTLTSSPNGLSFVPNQNFTGEVSFDYTVDDGFGSTDTQTIVLRNARFYAGIYRALPPLDGVNLGAVDVTVTAAGRATAAIHLNGARHAVAGTLKQASQGRVGFTSLVRRNGLPNLQVELYWELNGDLTARLSENEEELYVATGPAATVSPSTEEIIYNVVGAHTNVSGNAGGRVTAIGYVRLRADGRSTIRARFGDGTPIVAKGRVHKDGQIAVYAKFPRRAKSFVVGRLQPNPNNLTTSAPGLVVVQGPKKGTTPTYASDYRDLVNLAGPRFTVPERGVPPLEFEQFPLRLTLNASGGGIGNSNFTMPLFLSRSGKASGIIGINRLVINGNTGEFSGAFLPEGAVRTVPFFGILRPDQNGGVGVYRGAAGAGIITLDPQ